MLNLSSLLYMYHINHREVQLRCQAHQKRIRTRLLHTCILYLSIIVCKIYKKLASQPGLLGFLARTFPLPLAFPVLRAIQCCILAMASFADDQMLACENRIQQLLPPSSHVFDMLEWMVQYMIETLPATHVAELLIEWLSREERSSCVMEEKEIVVDSNSIESGLGACGSLVKDKEEEATVDEKLCNSLHQCEEYEPTDKERLIESFSSEKRTSRLAGEKKIVMDFNCTQSGLNAFSSFVNDKEEKVMVDEELYNSLHPCNQKYEPADKIKRLDALEEKKAAKRKGGKKKRHAKIVELEVPHNEMKDGQKHRISDGVREGKDSVEGLAKSEYKKEGSAKCEYKKVDEGDRILHLFEQGWIMQYCL